MASTHPTPPVPLPDMALWRHIATGNVCLGHLPDEAARMVRARAWSALRADRARRTGINPDTIAPGAGRAEVATLPTRRPLHRVTLSPSPNPGDAA